MNKLPLISSAIVFSFAALSGQTQEDFEIPYGNLGINYASDKINSANNWLDEKSGVSFFFDCYGVLLTNPYGGNSQATNFTQEMIFGLKFDLEKILSWKGGSFQISGAYNSGTNLGNDIGNFFTPSESLVTNGAIFYELYLGQKFHTDIGDFNLKMGRISMSDSFLGLPAFGNMVSGGMDSTPEAIFSNSPFTSSPTATWGATLTYSPTETISFSGGIFQVPANVQSPKWDGTNFTINSSDGYMMIFQAQWTPEFFAKAKDGRKVSGTGLEGVYQAGAYYFDGFEMPYFEGGGSRDNSYGFFLQAQQMVWRNEDNLSQYATLWAGAQYAPVKSVSIMPWMVYAGVQLQGFVPHRSSDGIFVSWMCGWFSGDYSDSVSYDATYETVIEATYVWQINNNIAIQPDIQYIMRPYGNTNIDDALVIGGQVVVSF